MMFRKSCRPKSVVRSLCLLVLLGLGQFCQAQPYDTNGSDVAIANDTPILLLSNPLNGWFLVGDIGFSIGTGSSTAEQFAISYDAPDRSMLIDADGVAFGIDNSQKVNNVVISFEPDRNLNLVSARTARGIVQGAHAAETYMVHTSGLTGRKIMRTRLMGGKYAVASVADNALSAIDYAFCYDLTTTMVGIKTSSPTKPLQVGDAGANDGNGAHVTKAGVWTNASSRTLKENIRPITSQQARATVRALQPVGYRYKNEPEEQYVGFIAEDVPELVATNDRKSLAAMDVVSVLTKVVQDQDRELEVERQRNDKLEQMVESLIQRVNDLEQNHPTRPR